MNHPTIMKSTMHPALIAAVGTEIQRGHNDNELVVFGLK